MPTNFLARFLSFCSYIFQCTRDDRTVAFARLCFVVLGCVVEDPFACGFLYDSNLSVTVELYRRVRGGWLHAHACRPGSSGCPLTVTRAAAAANATRTAGSIAGCARSRSTDAAAGCGAL